MTQDRLLPFGIALSLVLSIPGIAQEPLEPVNPPTETVAEAEQNVSESEHKAQMQEGEQKKRLEILEAQGEEGAGPVFDGSQNQAGTPEVSAKEGDKKSQPGDSKANPSQTKKKNKRWGGLFDLKVKDSQADKEKTKKGWLGDTEKQYIRDTFKGALLGSVLAYIAGGPFVMAVALFAALLTSAVLYAKDKAGNRKGKGNSSKEPAGKKSEPRASSYWDPKPAEKKEGDKK